MVECTQEPPRIKSELQPFCLETARNDRQEVQGPLASSSQGKQEVEEEKQEEAAAARSSVPCAVCTVIPIIITSDDDVIWLGDGLIKSSIASRAPFCRRSRCQSANSASICSA